MCIRDSSLSIPLLLSPPSPPVPRQIPGLASPRPSPSNLIYPPQSPPRAAPAPALACHAARRPSGGGGASPWPGTGRGGAYADRGGSRETTTG
eukprot:400500-Pyramimonas_sp.AAC.1